MTIKPLITLNDSPLALTLGSGLVSEDGEYVVKIVRCHDGRLLLDPRAKLRPQVDLNKSFIANSQRQREAGTCGFGTGEFWKRQRSKCVCKRVKTAGIGFKSNLACF